MADFIKEHKGVFIGIIAGVVAATLLIACVVAVKAKNKKNPTQPSVNSVVDESNEDLPTVSETQKTVESSEESNVSAETPTESEETTPIRQTQTTAPSTVNIPSGVETLTDGNKKVYYPARLAVLNEKYPVVVWANGTGCATETYDALLTKIADSGYIVVADSSVMTANGSAQRDSIDYIIGESKDSDSVFYGKVDVAKIGAAGHSQGGRSSVNAAQKDSRIKCIVSIAGASSAEEANGLNAPSLFLTGTADMVVLSSQWCKPSYDAAAGRAVYASLKKGVHTTCMTNPDKISEYVTSWFDAYLKNDASAKAKFENGGQLSKDTAWQDFAGKN